ncbi:MAG: TolC family protein [Trueperaceae bacterium]|nr:TolC family protein [Trueperaceae bacterium]
MKRFAIVVSVVAAVVIGFAAAQALNLAEVREYAPQHDPAVAAAVVRVERAQETQQRVERDPFALRLDRLAARHEVEAAAAAHAKAESDSRRAVTDAYLAVIEAELAADVAALAEQMSSITLEATRLRFQHGAVTQHDVDSTQHAYQSAFLAGRNAEEDLNGARRRLEALVPGLPIDGPFQAVADLPEVPDLDDLLSAAREGDTVVAAKRQLEIATIDLEAKNPQLDAALTIEASRAWLAEAQAGVTRAEDAAVAAVQRNHDVAVRALAALGMAREGLGLRLERLSVQRARHESGLISNLDLMNEEVAVRRAELDVARAVRAYLLAVEALGGL